MLDADAARSIARIRPKAGHPPDPLKREPARRRVTVIARLAVIDSEKPAPCRTNNYPVAR